jgi:hypothetical protein
MDWYITVKNDICELDNCVAYYLKEYESAKKEITTNGKLIDSALTLASYVETRYSQLQDIEAVLEYLNIQYNKVKSDKFKKLSETYNKALSSRDVEKYIEGEDDVMNMAILINDIARVRNKFLSIMKGFDTKNFMISHITKLSCAGIENISFNQ